METDFTVLRHRSSDGLAERNGSQSPKAMARNDVPTGSESSQRNQRYVCYRRTCQQLTPDEGAPYPASDKTALKRCVMAWLVLIVSGTLEAVWATALQKSDGFSRPIPSLIFVVALMFSMTGLAFAMRSLPTGTSYAVWVGIGAVLTVGYAMLTGDETASPIKVVLIAGVIGCIIGLKMVS